MGDFRYIVFSFASVLTLQACNQSSQDPATPVPRQTDTRTGAGTGNSANVAETVTYESWAKDYLTKNCTRCHSSQGGMEPDLTTYAKAKPFAKASLDAMIQGTMPQGGPKATKDQISKMQAWIANGTLEKKAASSGSQTPPVPGTTNSTGGRPTTPPVPNGSSGPAVGLTWTADIQPIFRSSCGIASNGCHSPQAPYGDLSTLEAAKRRVPGIRTSVNSGLMPRGSRLAEADKKKIVDWTNQGAN